jgi:hypothetical protein
MKQCALVFAFLLAACLSVSNAAATPVAPELDATVAAASGRLGVPASHRCVPSSCECRGSQAILCTMDCRRDRHCWCAGGKYVCRYLVGFFNRPFDPNIGSGNMAFNNYVQGLTIDVGTGNSGAIGIDYLWAALRQEDRWHGRCRSAVTPAGSDYRISPPAVPLVPARWALFPPPINAKSETVATLPTFWDARSGP